MACAPARRNLPTRAYAPSSLMIVRKRSAAGDGTARPLGRCSNPTPARSVKARTIASLSPKSAAPLVISRTRSSVVSSVVPVEDVDQDDALIAEVFGGGGRDVLIARPFRLVMHRKVCPFGATPPAVHAARGHFSMGCVG